MKYFIGLCMALAVSACSSPESDPAYLALKANPPTSIPVRHLPKLRRGIVSCDLFEEGTARQYMTCWWPNGSGTEAYLSFYGMGVVRPNPDNLIAPGGEGITPYLPII